MAANAPRALRAGPRRLSQLIATACSNEDEPVPIQAPEAVWPTGAKREGMVKVTLHVFVEPSGRVCYAKAIQGSEPFASSAIETVRHWTFKPAMSNGKPVGVWVEVPLMFKP